MTLGEKLESLMRTFPLLDPKTLAMVRTKKDFRKKYDSVAAYMILESSDGTYTLRAIVFTKKKSRSLKEWRRWLDANLADILDKSFLPALSLRSGKHWRMIKFVGFAPHHVVH